MSAGGAAGVFALTDFSLWFSSAGVKKTFIFSFLIWNVLEVKLN